MARFERDLLQGPLYAPTWNVLLSGCAPSAQAGGSVEVLLTQYAFDASDHLSQITFPDGTRTFLNYTPQGQVQNVRDVLGRDTGYTYDIVGRLKRTDFPDGTFAASTFDAAGRKTFARDRGGFGIAYGYDTLNRIATVGLADTTGTIQSQIGLVYDDAGRLAATVDPRGKVSSTDAAVVEGERASLNRLLMANTTRLSGLVYAKAGGPFDYVLDMASNADLAQLDTLASGSQKIQDPAWATTYFYTRDRIHLSNKGWAVWANETQTLFEQTYRGSAVAPEPSAGALLLVGVAGWWSRRRFDKKRQR